MLSYIADLQMKVFYEDDVVAKEWPKHPGIKKNNVLINSLLTRRRSAIHLTGNIKNGVLQWSSEMSEGTLSHLNDVIYVQNGGMYVVYCIIRFKKDACGPEGKVGYTIKHRSDMGPVVQIASVYKNCFNETYYDTELFIQKSFKLSVGQNSEIYFDTGNLENNLIDKDSQQSFGVFEL
ncbi:uncharacterized protein LOC132718227 [Ruditapes philippinarum]|uniref:uncharacterized protein LOC132718227 n=1 Tax=Ruditapes philippinarum TaxID=129788 RepID=UPI00295B9BDC|nr:uncharacterized protein LOC132718227 [Ruditapes philippinarum]